MKTRSVIIIWLSCTILFASFTMQKEISKQENKIESYERELIRASDEVMEAQEENAVLRKQIESMQMYIDMNINPQFYTVDVESDEKMGEVE